MALQLGKGEKKTKKQKNGTDESIIRIVADWMASHETPSLPSVQTPKKWPFDFGGCAGPQMDRRTEGWTHGRRDGGTHGRRDGWRDGWMDGWSA